MSDVLWNKTLLNTVVFEKYRINTRYDPNADPDLAYVTTVARSQNSQWIVFRKTTNKTEGDATFRHLYEINDVITELRYEDG